MPYSGPGDPNLPSRVKRLPERLRRMWVHVFNSCWEQHHDEQRCFSTAYGVVKREQSMLSLR